MIGTLEADKKQNWKQYISPLVHAYNCIKHESTSYAPYTLMFGREPKLPVDIAFGLNDNNSTGNSYSEYISGLQNQIKEAFDLVQKNADKARAKQKKIL